MLWQNNTLKNFGVELNCAFVLKISMPKFRLTLLTFDYVLSYTAQVHRLFHQNVQLYFGSGCLHQMLLLFCVLSVALIKLRF